MKFTLMILAAVTLAACQQEDKLPDSGLAGYDPNLVEIRRDDCIKRGGRFGQGGLSGAFVCVETPRDANKSCSKSTDCSGECLARSHTCSPIKPLFGCNEILTSTGGRVSLCVD